MALSLKTLSHGAAVLLLLTSVVQAGPLTRDSYHKARKVLDAAVEEMGGAVILNGIQTLIIEQSGTTYARNQSPSVSKPFEANPTTGRTVLDLQQGWILNESTTPFPGGFIFSNRTVIKGEEKYSVNLELQTIQPNANLQLSNFDFVQRLFPPLLIRKALQQAGTVRYLGQADLDGATHDVISFAWDNGGSYSLYIDVKTHRLSKYELVFPDTLTGDAISELYFLDYREQDGMLVPSSIRWRVNGEPFNDITYDGVKINETIEESVFDKPAGYVELEPAPALTPEVKELAQDVYLADNLGGGFYNSLFVEFEDYIFVVEAPLSPAVSNQAINLIRGQIPDKPIRYVAVTHHHDDHSGGLQAFAAAGATIVTTESNREYFEQMVAAQHTLMAGSPVDGAPKFEFVSGKKVYKDDAGHVVELYDIGPNPHANELLIAYLPGSKLLYQADMLSVPRSGPLTPAPASTVHFAETLAKMGLEVEQLIGVHGVPGTMKDLEEALKLAAPVQADGGQSR